MDYDEQDDFKRDDDAFDPNIPLDDEFADDFGGDEPPAGFRFDDGNLEEETF